MTREQQRQRNRERFPEIATFLDELNAPRTVTYQMEGKNGLVEQRTKHYPQGLCAKVEALEVKS